MEKRIESGVNTALDMVELLVAAGQPLKTAVAVSRTLTMQAVRESLAQDFSNKSGSVITHTLATTPVPPTPAPAQRRTKTNKPLTVS